MKIPPFLTPGDTIGIVAPAKAITTDKIDDAVNFWESNGFKVKVSENCLGRSNYFSGTDTVRARDFQTMLNDDTVKAIVCARGGYGCIRIMDRINWASLMNDPKWIIGFSDVTVFHQYLNKLEIASMHATMPLNYSDNTPESLDSMLAQLTGKPYTFRWNSLAKVKEGEVSGTLIGGNLAVLTSLIGTRFMPDFTDKILVLEEVGEPLYAIDRMFYQLASSGVLQQLKGLILGSFSAIKDTEVPYGESLASIVSHHLNYLKLPTTFDFPLGHQDDNRALIFGKTYTLTVEANGDSELKTSN